MIAPVWRSMRRAFSAFAQCQFEAADRGLFRPQLLAQLGDDGTQRSVFFFQGSGRAELPGHRVKI